MMFTFDVVELPCPHCQAPNRMTREGEPYQVVVTCVECARRFRVRGETFAPPLSDPVNAACADVLAALGELVPAAERFRFYRRMRPAVEAALAKGCFPTRAEPGEEGGRPPSGG